VAKSTLGIAGRRIEVSLDEENLGVRHATATKFSIWSAILVHEGDPIPGIPVEVSDHLTLSTSRLSGSRRRGVTDDCNFNVKFPATRTIPVSPLVKEAAQLFGLNERYRR
jgi:hypothetical protein